MYAAEQQAAGDSGGEDGDQGSPGAEDVGDAEFEEVDDDK
jgi:hypothetical protein